MRMVITGLLLGLVSLSASASVIVNEEYDDVKFAVIDEQSFGSFSEVSFNDAGHNCSRYRIADGEGWNIHHKESSCYSNMSDIETNVSKTFSVNADSIFDISFSADRIGYGTNYSSRVMWYGLFYMDHKRGSADRITLMDGTVLGASTTTNTNYRLSYNDEGFRFYKNQSLVHENLGYQIANPFTTYMQVRTNNARYFLTDLNIANYRERSEAEIAEILEQQSQEEEANNVEVPEPSSLALMGLGGLLIFMRKKRIV